MHCLQLRPPYELESKQGGILYSNFNRNDEKRKGDTKMTPLNSRPYLKTLPTLSFFVGIYSKGLSTPVKQQRNKE